MDGVAILAKSCCCAAKTVRYKTVVMSPAPTQILCFPLIAPGFYEGLDSLKFEYYERSAA